MWKCFNVYKWHEMVFDFRHSQSDKGKTHLDFFLTEAVTSNSISWPAMSMLSQNFRSGSRRNLNKLRVCNPIWQLPFISMFFFFIIIFFLSAWSENGQLRSLLATWSVFLSLKSPTICTVKHLPVQILRPSCLSDLQMERCHLVCDVIPSSEVP